MDKRITFDSVDSLGNVFAEAIDISPRGGGLHKIAGTQHPEVVRFLAELRPDPAYQYVLMAPMGASEYWSMNRNGDYFPECSLRYDRRKDNPLPVMRELEAKWLLPHGKRLPPGEYKNFGHQTFLEAKSYRHHANKDPSRAYGDIILAVWNDFMKRVEVIVRHDREKAKQVGAEEIILDIDAGRPRSVSMGCRVGFDVCTRCGNIAKTAAEYCSHLRPGMGTMNPDGTMNAAVNFFPRFFDLSDVFIPAAKESGVLKKVASVQTNRVHDMLQKLSANKHAENKHATIEKEVLPNTGPDAVSDAASREEDIPKPQLMKGGLASLLTTLAALGIILKPSEFQQAFLHRAGHGEYADELDRKGMVFSQVAPSGRLSLDPGSYDPLMARQFAPMLPGRSCFMPHLPNRVVRISVLGTKVASAPRTAIDGPPLLKKVASVYADYRESLRTIPDMLEHVVERDPSLYANHFLGDLLTDSMEKSASVYREGFLSGTLVPLYVYSAHMEKVSHLPSSWFRRARHPIARAVLEPVL